MKVNFDNITFLLIDKKHYVDSVCCSNVSFVVTGSLIIFSRKFDNEKEYKYSVGDFLARKKIIYKRKWI